MVTFPDTTPPQPGFDSAELAIRNVVQETSNNFNMVQRKNTIGSAKWTGSLTLPQMEQAQAREWKAWLTRMRGQRGTFRLGDPGYFGPYGSVNNKGIVDQVPLADKYGHYLSTSGYESNKTIFKKGDQFEINNELKICVKDIESSNNGDALLIFMPRLRDTNVTGGSIIYDQPQGEFRLGQNLNQWDDRTVISNIDIDVMEVTN
jgi:hypothetical protein